MKSRAMVLNGIEKASFDLCVIGGGATGAGCALDAQLRGLRTILVGLVAGSAERCSRGIGEQNQPADADHRSLKRALDSELRAFYALFEVTI